MRTIPFCFAASPLYLLFSPASSSLAFPFLVAHLAAVSPFLDLHFFLFFCLSRFSFTVSYSFCLSYALGRLGDGGGEGEGLRGITNSPVSVHIFLSV